jgi:hypothetical protein
LLADFPIMGKHAANSFAGLDKCNQDKFYKA